MKTEINIYVLISILIIHWIADFIFQNDQQATEKSKSNYYLSEHVLTYTIIWFACCITYATIFIWKTIPCLLFIFCFPAITFVCHWITDYFTSRINSRLFKDGKRHQFFVSVGFDQILHYVQLVLTFQLLTSY